MNPVSASSSISRISQAADAIKARATSKTDGKSGFGDLVNKFVEQTNNDQLVSDAAIQDFATGKTDNVEEVVLAMANADMSFQLFMEIRNHLIDSYNDLMRMQF
jgi:flagellar hook-basal body complex protein FliE